MQKKLNFGTLLAVVIAGTMGFGTTAHAQVVKGNGTPNTIPVWENNSMQGNSIVSQSSGNINVNGGGEGKREH